MNLDRTNIAVSITDDNRSTFKLLDSIRPNYISFSQYLGVAANEYYEKHKDGITLITDFTNKDIIKMPNYYSEIEMWKKYINNMPTTEVKKFQRRRQQLGILIDKKIEGMLR
jgi:hypothetical protein